ncbi:hypothetical protein [Methanoregula sp.]|uniref:hypothetical protein n=1 Tax=Methanoregula sp. TaxID=2052170 RepID=UPI003568A040
MTEGRFRRLQVLSVAGLVCIILLVTLASAADQASGTLAGKNTPPGQDPVQHPDKSTPVPRTTQASAPVVTTPAPAPGTTQVLQTPVPSATNVAPTATQTTDTSSSALSNPSIIAASIGLVSAGIGAGVTLYTHAKKK